MKSLFILFGLIAVVSGFYLEYHEDFQSMHLTQVFAQSENKNSDDFTVTQSSNTSTDTKSKINKSQGDSNDSLSNGNATETGKKFQSNGDGQNLWSRNG